MSRQATRRSAIEEALTKLRRRSRDFATPEPPALTPAVFRAVIEERLRSLDRQLEEVKGRVNGLLFLLAGSMAAQIILGLAA